jgi:hypothetical protein
MDIFCELVQHRSRVTVANKPFGDPNGNGGNDFMAKVIEFYIPARFRKPPAKWIPVEQRGKVLEFVPRLQKTA